MPTSYSISYRVRNFRIEVPGTKIFLKYQRFQYCIDFFQTGKVGEILQVKHEKHLKPVSLRVRDAAEFLLTSLVEQVGNFPTPTGADSPSCLLKEEDLLYQLYIKKTNSSSTLQDSIPSAPQHFRYFAVSEGTMLLGVLEQPPSLPNLGKTCILQSFHGTKLKM